MSLGSLSNASNPNSKPGPPPDAAFYVLRLTSYAPQLPPQIRAHQLALFKATQIKLFVRGMSIVVGERQSKHERVGTQDLLELIDDGDRTTFAHEHRLKSERFSQGSDGGLSLRAFGGNQIGNGAVTGSNLEMNGGRAEPLPPTGMRRCR